MRPDFDSRNGIILSIGNIKRTLGRKGVSQTFTISVAASSVSEVGRKDFVNLATAVCQCVDDVRRTMGISEYDAELILTDDFLHTVRTVGKDETYSGRRTVGQAVGICIPKDETYTQATLIFDALSWAWKLAETSPKNTLGAQMVQVHLIAHELAHSLLGRIRSLGGVPKIDREAIATTSQLTHNITQTLVDEYRADRFADLVVRSVMQQVVGIECALGSWDTVGAIYLPSLIETLGEAYPRWPDTVQRYREHKMGLEAMFQEVATSVKDSLLILMHTQALADAAGQEELLEGESVSELRAVRLYLLRPWVVFMKVVRQAPIIPSVDAVGTDDTTLAIAGEKALREIWSALGLTLEDYPDAGYAIWVKEPLR